MASKTAINLLFNDILYYLFIACFDCKIGVFQQTVERVYYILKATFVLILTFSFVFLSSNVNKERIIIIKLSLYFQKRKLVNGIFLIFQGTENLKNFLYFRK